MPEICLSTKAWRSGAAWFNQQLAQAIAHSGATIAFVAPMAEPEAREPQHANLRRVVIPREGGDHRWWRRRLASLRRVGAGVWSVVVLRGSTRTFVFSIPEPLLFSLPLFALLRVSGAQVVLVVHDAVPHVWSLPRWARQLERWSLAAAYRVASQLVCLTRSTRTALESEFGIWGGKVSVIPHGAFAGPSLPPIPGNRRLLLFGSIRPNKRVLETIRAVVRLREEGAAVSLTIAGEPWDSAYWSRCKFEMARSPEGFVTRVEFVPEDDVAALLGDADALVLPYADFESQSGVAVLAALAGRPVIGTRSGGLAELFDRGMAGQVIAPEVTPEAIAVAIREFYARPLADWRAAADAGRERLASALAWGPIGSAYVRLARGKPYGGLSGVGDP